MIFVDFSQHFSAMRFSGRFIPLAFRWSGEQGREFLASFFRRPAGATPRLRHATYLASMMTSASADKRRHRFIGRPRPTMRARADVTPPSPCQAQLRDEHIGALIMA